MWNYQRKSFLAVSIVVFIASVQCNLIADTRPSYVTKQEGETVDLLCTFGRSIERCDFDMPSGQRIKLNPNVAERDGFSYYGEGFERGQCGLTITKLSKEHEGNFTCRLDLGIESEDAVGMIQVSIAKPPRDLDMKVSDLDRLQANQELYAECKFRDGRPQARILWYLGSDLINSQNQQTDELHDPDDEGLVSSRITHILRPEDNLKLLICRLEQSALENGFTNVTTQLDVKYQPMALSREELHIPGLQIGSNVDIKVLIRANPRPHLRWTIDGVDVRVGDQNRKYDASDAIRVEDGRWEAKLTVAALTLEDTLKTYTLRAENGIGNHMDYAIRIGGSPDIEGSGLGIIPIIAITVIVLFVLIIVALLVVARITKRWCFAGASMHPNSPDSEAQIAPDDDKTHEHYEQHESKVSDEESGDIDHTIKTANGKSNGNTSV